MTNDSTTSRPALQQTLCQLLTSLLTVVAVLAMMFWISWQLALVALVTDPVSMVVTTARSPKRSQKLSSQQWTATGQLNGIVEETFTGHGLVKVFGRQRESQAQFDAEERASCTRPRSARSSSAA